MKMERYDSPMGVIRGLVGEHLDDELLEQILETMPEFNSCLFLWDQGNRIEIVARFN